MSISELSTQIGSPRSDLMHLFEEVLLHPESINWSEKRIDNEDLLKRLIEAAALVNYELAKYLKHMLIQFYVGNRRYKEAYNQSIGI